MKVSSRRYAGLAITRVTHSGHQPGVVVTVGVITYRRPDEVRRCLDGVLSEVSRTKANRTDDIYQVIVVDNDPNGSGFSAVEELDSPLIRYVLDPTPGISAARNRALDESPDSDVMLFIDDDEEPRPGWLAQHLDTWQRTGAAAVAGRVVSEFDGPVDQWVVAGRFFDRPRLPTGTRLAVAASNNLLLDLRVVRSLSLRFAERFGLSGGGDTYFTRSLTGTGAVMVWCDEAVVTDHVPDGRATKRWVLRRARRMANTEVMVSIELTPNTMAKFAQRVKAGFRGGARLLGGSYRYASGRIFGSLERRAKGEVTIWRGFGMLDAAVGSTVAEYLRSADHGHAVVATTPERGVEQSQN